MLADIIPNPGFITLEETVLAAGTGVCFGDAKLKLGDGTMAELVVIFGALKLKFGLYSCELLVEEVVSVTLFVVEFANFNNSPGESLVGLFFPTSVLGFILDSPPLKVPKLKGEAELLLTGPAEDAVVVVLNVKSAEGEATLVEVLCDEFTDIAEDFLSVFNSIAFEVSNDGREETEVDILVANLLVSDTVVFGADRLNLKPPGFVELVRVCAFELKEVITVGADVFEFPNEN